ncbi:NAD dependent deacetylase, putative [Trypanosoma brucei gambiense DAL972]|uniref:NAD-dependent protein deacylase n=2 Tax=Trypanosoma brucei TaxID=5691 RepID=C9ZMP3_TRYB9|nr:NAD dependent deacetylase, putative [Trypanosoma brucei gambiense DAL972]RHW72757.1 NAD dependent deacetylase [Trypanosoma brucei equiperdum]CBH10546.1 NAD dependent deacetylase, putative [Trypanosoma brucei gambiense DAL972]|eukprot:XP_011772835.1 NAD dependent deacetylase, putative [Trypanosoma brucei gambiense DAL972]
MRRPNRMIAILTGAGISAESGISTFRDQNGLWENHRVEDVCTPAAFLKQPTVVQRFYNERRRALLSPEVKPNASHQALARLQREYKDGQVVIITQNIDDLHERAGSRQVLHMHGELLKVRCTATGRVFESRDDVIHGESKCECCGVVETLRPHIVWFNEMPLYMDVIDEVVQNAGLFVAVGTSGNVYPAAGLVMIAKAHGAETLELNLEPSGNCRDFDRSVYGPASVIVPAWADEVLHGKGPAA